jgi:hypothetical protein
VSLLPGPNQAAFSFDCNGTRVKGWTDTFSYVGGVNTAGSVTCAETVTDGLIEPVIRWQGVSLQSNPCCSQPIYSAGGSDFLEVAGLVVCVSSYSTIGGRPRARELEPCWVSAQQRASNPYQLPGILRADH